MELEPAVSAAKGNTTVTSIGNAVSEFIKKHPRATIRDARAHAKAEFNDDELAAAFVKAWLDRTVAAAEFLSEVERR